ncbi:MAG: hypothetical protein LBK82_08165 [Planctomycetaceae bacterium]|nr:hypothetical protein [Planctomycetaceae bacterium]
MSRHPITTEKFIKDCELDANIDNDTESFVLAVRNTISILAKIPSDLIVPNDIIERDIYVSHWLWEFNCAYFMETLENETNFDFDSKLLEKVHDPSMEPFITVKNLISDLLSVRELQSPIKTIR